MAKDLWQKLDIREWGGVFFVVVLAFVLRILWLPGNLFFGFEQGRDFLKLAEITSGNLALIGPGTDIPGIFHGALSYYVPLPFFLLFGGDPLWTQISFIAINCAAIVFLYKAVKDLFNSRVALVSSLFYAISYSAIIYSRWLSNPTLVPALTILILYFLVRAKKNNWSLVPMVLSWAVIFHLEIVAAITLVVPILAFLIFEKIRLNIKVVAICLFSVLLVLSSYVVFDLKNDHILLNGLKNYISAPKSGTSDFRGSMDQFSNELTDNIYPESRNVSLVIFWGMVVWVLAEVRKQKRNLLILLFLLISPVAYFVYGMRPQRHFYIFVPIFLSILFALFFDHLTRVRLGVMAVALLIFVTVFNLKTYYQRVPNSVGNFIHHAQRMYLSDEKALIDYVYHDADGKMFSYDYYSIPYWKKESWQYLFSWYGRSKYGYLPEENRTDTFYVLIEPDEIQPPYQNEWYDKLGDHSTLISFFESGKLKAEKRIVR